MSASHLVPGRVADEMLCGGNAATLEYNAESELALHVHIHITTTISNQTHPHVQPITINLLTTQSTRPTCSSVAIYLSIKSHTQSMVTVCSLLVVCGTRSMPTVQKRR